MRRHKPQLVLCAAVTCGSCSHVAVWSASCRCFSAYDALSLVLQMQERDVLAASPYPLFTPGCVRLRDGEAHHQAHLLSMHHISVFICSLTELLQTNMHTASCRGKAGVQVHDRDAVYRPCPLLFCHSASQEAA
jgi:hypothetical protein